MHPPSDDIQESLRRVKSAMDQLRDENSADYVIKPVLGPGVASTIVRINTGSSPTKEPPKAADD